MIKMKKIMTGQGPKIKTADKMTTKFSKLDYFWQGARTRTKPGSIVCDWPLRVRHCVCVCCRSLLMDVATRPLLHLPRKVHHARVCTRMSPLEALVPIRGRNYSTGLRGVWLHPHVWRIRGIALGNILKRETWDVISGFQWMLNKSTLQICLYLPVSIALMDTVD